GPALVREIKRRLEEEPIHDEFRKKIEGIERDSIDQFVKEFPKYKGVVRRTISEIILMRENKDVFSVEDKDDHFYQYFVNKVSPDRYKEFTIVTFNYDRSFERFISNYLHHKYEGDKRQIRYSLRELKIIHVHGRLPLLNSEMDVEIQNH